MANITAALVKELRERTNAGMMDCKKALVESDGDMDKAIDWLREKGLAQAAKKAGRIAAEGAVVAYMTPCGCTGALVEVNCETDFVANTDNFKNFANAVAKHVALANPADLDELMKQKFVDDESKTIEDMVSDATVAIGEKITVRRFARYETEGVVSSYIHMGGKIGVVVECAAGVSDETIHDVALQIAAAKPLYVKDEEVPADVIEKEKEILLAQIKNDEKLANKPAQVIDKMVEGKVKKYYEENCLLNQAFVKDPSVTVGALLKKENSTVLRFTRYEMGEGLEKKTNDFAAEVEAQMKK